MSRKVAAAAAAAGPAVVDLWSKIVAERSEGAASKPVDGKEATLLFVGNANSGKTTLINLFKGFVIPHLQFWF